MTRWIAILAVIAGFLGANSAQAQTPEAAPGPGTVEVTIIPGGATFFTEASDSGGPSFGNYDLGGSVTFNFNRYHRYRRRGQRSPGSLAKPGLRCRQPWT